jgi:DNA-binding transcriptional regulator YiaG
MATFAKLMHDEIARVARKATKRELKMLRALSAGHRKHIAALRREVQQLRKECATLRRRASSVTANPSTASEAGKRFRVDGFKAWRQRTGISANDLARLLGKSGQTIYNWEGGTSRPSREVLSEIARIRALGKRGIIAELQALGQVEARESKRRLNAKS